MIISSASSHTGQHEQGDELQFDKAYRRLPSADTTFILGVRTGAGEEVTPLGYVLLSLLSPNFDLLLLATAPELILLQATLTLVLCEFVREQRSRVDGKRERVSERGGAYRFCVVRRETP